MGCYPDDMAAESKQMGVRCTFEEETCIRSAATALDVETSVLVELSMIDQCNALGMLVGSPTPPRLKPGYSWDFEPARADGDSAKTRLTVYASALLYPSFEAAAWTLRVSMPLFAIGSTLRYIAALKADNASRKTEKTYNAALAKVTVPYDFDKRIR